MAIANITGNILTDSGIATSSLLPLSGGTITGFLTSSKSITTGENGQISIIPSTNTSAAFLQVTNTDGTTYFGKNNNSGSYLSSSPNATLVYSTGSSPIMLYTNGNMIMTLTGGTPSVGGNVLINTTSDNGAKLQVSGAATFSGSVQATSIGVNTAPSYPLHILRATGSDYIAKFEHTSATVVTQGVLINTPNDTSDTSFLLNVQSASTSRFVVKGNGNVGIGTSSPNAVLEVAGTSSTSDFRISRTVSSSTYFFIKAPGGSPSASQLGVNGTDVMTLNASGNVGIGTSSVPNTLVIQNTGENSIEWHRSNAMQGMIGIPSASNQIITGSSLNDFCFRATSKMLFATGGDTERMRITSGGNVLIGTTTDTGYMLRVTGYANIGGNLVVDGDMTAKGSFNGFSGATQKLLIDWSGESQVTTLTATNLFFGTNAQRRMTITSGGKVNINNNSNTNYQLYVDGGSSSAFAAYSTSPNNQFKLAGTAPGLTINNTITSPTIGGALGACTSANDFITGTAAGDMILINQFTGNKLYITNYSGGVYLTQGATSWTANSDIRIKNINSNITNAVEKLSTLQTINFCYKDDISKKENLGLIAQEVEMVFPELIETNNDGILGVRYTELIPVLIEAIKELKLELDKIKNK